MTHLSVALIAASDSNLFDIPIHYSRDNTEDFISKLNNDETNTLIYGAHAARRAVRVHNAIATILVSQPTDEVVAVGASRSKDGLLTIYISASGERASLSTLYKARLHLEGVWKRLGSLVDEHPQQGTESPQDMDMSSDDKVFDLMLYVYRHSMERVIERFTKGDLLGVGDFIAEAVCAPAAYVKDEAPESQEQTYVLRSKLVTLRFFWAVLLTVRAYQENKSDDNLQEFNAAIDVICKKLDESGDSVWGEASDSLFSRCDRLLKERINTRLKKPVAFARFWKKAFTLHRAIKQLLYLTASTTMRSQLKGPFAVEIVPPQKGLFEYDLGADSFRAVFSRVPHRGITRLLPPKSMTGSAIQSDKSSGSPMDISSEGSSHRTTGSSDSDSSQLTYDRFIARYRTKRPLQECKEVHVHCELTLLTYFLTKKIAAYGFIAVSKLSCLGCWFYFLAHNEVAEKNGRRLYHVRGTHSKAYHGWIKPVSGVALDQEIDGVFVNSVETHFASIKDQFAPRKWSDSAIASSGVVNIRAIARLVELSGGDETFMESLIRKNPPSQKIP